MSDWNDFLRETQSRNDLTTEEQALRIRDASGSAGYNSWIPENALSPEVKAELDRRGVATHK